MSDSTSHYIETRVRKHHLYPCSDDKTSCHWLSAVSIRIKKKKSQNPPCHISLCGLFCHRGNCDGAAFEYHEQGG